MLDRVFNQASLLEKGLDASWKRNEVIAGNIAHADTPGYKTRRVEFEPVFKDALNTGSLSLRQSRTASDNHKHVSIQDDSSGIRIETNNRTSMRLDGNNVDVDQEMTELAKNQIVYDTLTYTVSKELGRIRTVISEGK